VPVSSDRVFAFSRWTGDRRLLVVASFDDRKSQELQIDVPADQVAAWGLGDGRYTLQDLLYGDLTVDLEVDDGAGTARLQLEPLQSLVLRVGD
jgi:Alpha amylase, C-terminal all-beta domain